ncbi:MAG TPA: DUF4838 domain-containing protein [Pirellulales bacterium]
MFSTPRLTFFAVYALAVGPLVFLPAIAAAEAPATHRVQLADGGQPRVQVVIGPQAAQRVKEAAETLAAMLGRISGAHFEVVAGDGTQGLAVGLPRDFQQAPTDARLSSTDPTRREDYLLRSHPGGVYLLGASQLAVEHAVWDFLYRLGYRQFFPGEHWEVLPKTASLAIDVSAEEHPDYYARRIWYGFGPADYARGPYAEWCARNRATSGIVLESGHAYDGILARHKAEFAAHPEYLGFVDGRRQSTKFCISNPGLRKLVVDDALARLTADEDSLSIEPSDGGGWCECEACARLGSISDRAVLLANAVADAVRNKEPGKFVGMYAYNQHSPPPKIQVHPGVVVGVATAFIKSDFSVEQLVRGWQEKGATIGIREYLAVFPWDHDLPGKPRAASPDYLSRTIPEFQSLGARFYSAESSDAWGPDGVGYYLAARMLWDADEGGHVDRLIEDFVNRAFAGVEQPMREFYRLIDGRNRPLPSDDLLGRMYRALEQARQRTADPKLAARLDDLVQYTRYVELWLDYERASGEARQKQFEQLLRWAWRMRRTMMVHVTALWRDLPHRDKSVTLPAEASFFVQQDHNPWKDPRPITRPELDQILAEAIARRRLVAFRAVAFSHELVPIEPLELPPVKAGNFGATRGEQAFYTWVATPPATIELNVTAGLIYNNQGAARLELYPAGEAEGRAVAQAQVAPDKRPTSVVLSTSHAGLQRITLADRRAGTRIEWADGLPLTIESSSQSQPSISGRWTLYFYVPKGTQTLGGYAAGSGTIDDADGRQVYRFEKYTDYFHVPVPASQTGRLWRLRHCSGQVQLMTVPPYLARSQRELLLPREVVAADARSSR